MDGAEFLRLPRTRREGLIEERARLDETIRAAEAAMQQQAPPAPEPTRAEPPELVTQPHTRPGRLSLAERRERLRALLVQNGPATRGQILAETGMPPGTLSVLPNGPDFGSTRYGTWQVSGDRPEEGPRSMD